MLQWIIIVTIVICAGYFILWSIRTVARSPLPPSMMPDIEDVNHDED